MARKSTTSLRQSTAKNKVAAVSSDGLAISDLRLRLEFLEQDNEKLIREKQQAEEKHKAALLQKQQVDDKHQSDLLLEQIKQQEEETKMILQKQLDENLKQMQQHADKSKLNVDNEKKW